MIYVLGENTVNGDHSDAHHSTFSHSSKEVCHAHTFVLYLITCAHTSGIMCGTLALHHTFKFFYLVSDRCHAYDFHSIEKRQMRKKSVDYREKKGKGTSRDGGYAPRVRTCVHWLLAFTYYTLRRLLIWHTHKMPRTYNRSSYCWMCTISQDTISTHINIFNLMIQTCHFTQKALF